ncbi:MAG: SDR family oxidoreductase [Gemmatimonadota bacterium]
MRILIAGGAGMLGHQLFMHLRSVYDVKVTLREDIGHYARHGLFDSSNAYGRIDVTASATLDRVLMDFQPHAIINCIGIVKQLPIAKESIPSIEINALLPHKLAQMARKTDARLVHFSTDCVFSGRKGGYTETDTPDAEDLYGRTKLLGEVRGEGCLTLRTSLIGHELGRNTSLVEWFLSQKGHARGFRNAIFNGFTTIEMARIVEMLLTKYPAAQGVWHVSSDPIDKYTLLNLIRKHYRLDIQVEPDDVFKCKRSLDSTPFRKRFEYRPPSWENMIEEMSRLRAMQR